MAQVTIYTTPTCGYCKEAKAYFEKKQIPYISIDISEDPVTRDIMIQKSGQMGVPVIDIDGQIIVGFDEEAITIALNQKQT